MGRYMGRYRYMYNDSHDSTIYADSYTLYSYTTTDLRIRVREESTYPIGSRKRDVLLVGVWRFVWDVGNVDRFLCTR